MNELRNFSIRYYAVLQKPTTHKKRFSKGRYPKDDSFDCLPHNLTVAKFGIHNPDPGGKNIQRESL